MNSEFQHARDYNRGLAWPVRVVHWGWAALLWIAKPVRKITGMEPHRDWARPAVWGLLLAMVVGQWDGQIARFVAAQTPFGAGLASLLLAATLLSCVFAAPLVWWVNSDEESAEQRGRVARWATAFIVLFVVCRAAPLLIGRPRPEFSDPSYFIGPFGRYPLGAGLGVRYSWEFWVPGVSRVWSMPSRAAAYAFFAAWTIGGCARRWRGAAWILGVVSVFLAVASGQEYASDVVVGATVGIAAARVALRRG